MSSICCSNIQSLYNKHLNENRNKQAEENVRLEITQKIGDDDKVADVGLQMLCQCRSEGATTMSNNIKVRDVRELIMPQVYLITFLLALILFSLT